jgi:protein O-mannosyl-transferase
MSKRLLFFLISSGLVLIVLIAFEPLRHNDFISYDDIDYVTMNPHVQSGLTWQSIRWAFTTGFAANWHPLTWLSHMLDVELFGLNPVGHHIHSLLLHTLSTVLLFWLLYEMTGAVWCSAFAAMIFGIHPLRVESVAWAAERKDVLSMLFFMLTLAAYLYYVKRGGTGRYLLVLLCFAMGLLAKPMLVTLPIVLMILDFWPLLRLRSGLVGRTQVSADRIQMYEHHPASIWNLAAEKIPLFIFTFASCIVTYLVQQKGGAVNKLDKFPFISRIANALVSYMAYLYKTVLPKDLAVLYPNPFPGWPLWKPVISFLLLASISGIVIYNIKKRPYLVAGWLWYMITLIPVIGLVQVGSQSMADRYSYLPSIGILIMLSWTAAQLSAKWRYQRILMGILSGLAAIAMVVGTRTQLAYWKNSVTLFEHTLAATENNYLIHNDLGAFLLKQNRFDEAANHFKKVLRAWPDFPDANNNLTTLLIRRKQFDEAMDYVNRSLKARSNNAAAYCNMGLILDARGKFDEAMHAYEQAIQFDQNCFQAINNLGVLKIRYGLLDEAIKCFRQSIQINSKYVQAYCNLVLALQKQKKYEESIPYGIKALEIDPNNPDTWYNLALSQQSLGQLQAASDSYHHALQCDPNSIVAINNQAWLLAAHPETNFYDPAKAVSLALRGCKLTSFKNSGILDTLAVAYAAVGQFKEAVQTAQKAIDTANAAGQSDLAERIKIRLQLYQTSKPYCDPLSQK